MNNNILLTSVDYIKGQTEITDNLWDKKILPAIREAQDFDLQEITGGKLYQKLKLLVADGTITDEGNALYKELLDDYVQPYLSYIVIARLTLIMGQKIANIGVIENNDDKSSNMSFEDRGQLRQYYLNIAARYAWSIQRFVINHIDFFDVTCGCKEYIASNLYSHANCSMWLGGERNPNGITHKRWSDQ